MNIDAAALKMCARTLVLTVDVVYQEAYPPTPEELGELLITQGQYVGVPVSLRNSRWDGNGHNVPTAQNTAPVSGDDASTGPDGMPREGPPWEG